MARLPNVFRTSRPLIIGLTGSCVLLRPLGIINVTRLMALAEILLKNKLTPGMEHVFHINVL